LAPSNRAVYALAKEPLAYIALINPGGYVGRGARAIYDLTDAGRALLDELSSE
jgi:hypothetical protein